MTKRTLNERDIHGALLAGARWLANPVSEGGVKQVPRIKLLAAGPEILADIDRVRTHPTGKRILDERPDLGVALSDSDTLKAMPAGSLGRTFYDAIEIPGGIPGFLLAATIYKDGFFDSFEMSEEAQYYIARSRWLHDLFHIVTGYGTDLPGEGLLIYFALGYEHRLPYWAASIAPLGIGPRFFIRPSVGQRRWRGLLRDAHARGLAANRACPPECVPWKELLPRPRGRGPRGARRRPLPRRYLALARPQLVRAAGGDGLRCLPEIGKARTARPGHREGGRRLPGSLPLQRREDARAVRPRRRRRLRRSDPHCRGGLTLHGVERSGV